MKNTNTSKKQTSQATRVKNTSSYLKIAKPRPHETSETTVQGPRDCFPLG